MPTYRSFINASSLTSVTDSPTQSANDSPASSSSDLTSGSSLNRRLVLSLLLVTPSGTIQFPLSLPRNDQSRNSHRSQSSECTSSRATSPDSSTAVNSSQPSDGRSSPTFASDETSCTQNSMIYSVFSTAVGLFKSVLGSNSNMSAATVIPTETANISSQARQHTRTLTWAAQANEEFRRQIEESDDEDEEPAQEQSYSVEQEVGRRGNGDSETYKDMRPVLKGSPKLLGWNVDEKEEQAAWVKLMADAMSSSIFDVMTEEQRLIELTERQETEKELQSKRDLYQIWLENWEDDHVELHWRINVSLDGNHTWLLQPRITGSALGSTALSSTYTASLAHQTVDAEVDTRDLVNHSHTEMSIQTETEPVPVKTYGEAAIQAPEDPEVPIGALAPLDGEPSSLLHVGSPDMPRPGTPSQVSISSPPGTPASRIPRLAPAAKASMTSLLIDSPVSSNTALVTEAPSESTTTQPTTAKPTPSRSSTKILGALRGSPSLKSLSLRRQPSTVSTKDAVSTASGTVVGTPSKSVTSGGLPTPVEENPPARPGVMSRQTNKVLDAFKPSQSMRTLGLRRQPSQQSTKGSIPTGAAPPTPEPTTDGSDTSSVSKPKNTRFLSAVRKMQKTNSVMQAWKP